MFLVGGGLEEDLSAPASNRQRALGVPLAQITHVQCGVGNMGISTSDLLISMAPYGRFEGHPSGFCTSSHNTLTENQ